MNLSKCLFLLFILFLFPQVEVWSTTFIPVPLEDQVRDAYGVIQGKYLGSTHKKLSNGEVVTEATFKIIKAVGLKHNEIINKNSFKISYPGGEWQGVIYNVHGSPKFRPGEESIILISRGSYGFRVQNLALGKYNIETERDGAFLTSSVFPNHPKLGKISFSEFQSVLRERYGSSLEAVDLDKFIYKGPAQIRNGAGRKIASEAEEESKKENPASGIEVVWLIFIMAGLGASRALLFKRQE